MISSKKELDFYIMSDIIMAGYPEKKSIKTFLKNLFFPNLTLKYLRFMRKTSYYKNHNRMLFAYYKYRYERLGVKLGFSIGEDVFGYGLYIPHYGTIVVNNNVRAGNYCVLHTSSCIGGKTNKIGNALYVSSGAKVIGNVSLGDNVSISSNTFVNKTIEESNILLVGTPAIIKKNKCQPWYIRDGNDYLNRINRIEQLKQSLCL